MKKHYLLFKNDAIKLRKKGLSYGEIRKTIPVSKSTLSLWLKAILLKPKYKKRLYTKQIEILSRGPQCQKERRDREVKEIIINAEKEISLPLSFETYRLMGAALYWAEGSKGKMCQLTNSDPSLVLFFVKWLELMLKVSPKTLRARLNIYPQQNDGKIKRFWSDITAIPVNNFGKSYIKPLSTGYKKNNLYYGTIRIEVPKSVNFQHRIFGWINAAIKDAAPHVSFVRKRWKYLTETARPINLS